MATKSLEWSPGLKFVLREEEGGIKVYDENDSLIDSSTTEKGCANIGFNFDLAVMVGGNLEFNEPFRVLERVESKGGTWSLHLDGSVTLESPDGRVTVRGPASVREAFGVSSRKFFDSVVDLAARENKSL